MRNNGDPSVAEVENMAFIQPFFPHPIVTGRYVMFDLACPRQVRARPKRPLLCAVKQSPSDDDVPKAEPSIFAPETPGDSFWTAVSDGVSLTKPLSESEREDLMRALPGPVARFLIRRADQSQRIGNDWQNGRGANGILASLMKDNPFSEPSSEEEDWYNDYVFETIDDRATPFTGRSPPRDPDSQGETTVDGLASSDMDKPKKRVSLFTGSPEDNNEQLQQLLYALLGLVLLLFGFKVIFAFIQFFVSFTFSFLAIFALSAGIFVFFYFVRF